ncbi:CCXG family PEP-CTERM protein [Janthinobacterium sp. Mn2066]|uniref:CCXG family PEP-CTERM protein n=1 Tax=Janthinobacterium sp. Mn2066 TaxID=3395264 RepID=UPI003BC7E181
MKNYFKAALCLTAVAAFAHANASTILFSTGFSEAGPQASAAAYREVVDAAIAAPVKGYGTAMISSYDNVKNSKVFGSGDNVAFKSSINFGVSAAQAGIWNFRAGVDFGKGGALFVDGVALDFKANDMVWGGSYANPGQYLSASVHLAPGNHVLSIYGVEGCCDGSQQVQFQYGKGNFTSFGASDGLVSIVPEPSTYAMLLIGLGLLGFTARRTQTVQFRA